MSILSALLRQPVLLDVLVLRATSALKVLSCDSEALESLRDVQKESPKLRNSFLEQVEAEIIQIVWPDRPIGRELERVVPRCITALGGVNGNISMEKYVPLGNNGILTAMIYTR